MIDGVDFKKFKRFIIENYGERCSKYELRCIVCVLWRIYDDLVCIDEEIREIEEMVVDNPLKGTKFEDIVIKKRKGIS